MIRSRRWPFLIASAVLACAAAEAREPPQDAAPLEDGPAVGSMPAMPPVGVTANTNREWDALFTEDDLLLFEVDAGGVQFTDSLGAYSSRAGLYLPLGEFARLLDLAIMVDPATQRAEGWFLSEKRRFLLDLPAGRATVDGKVYPVSQTDAVLFRDEIYIRSELLERLLPLAIEVNKSGLTITLKTRESFPFEERLAREKRRGGLTPGAHETERVLKIVPSYAALSPPAADLTADVGWNSRSPHRISKYDLRLAGDVAFTGMQLYAGSDQQGVLSQMRLLFERKDPDGRIAGLFGATKSDAGDVYSQALSLGLASVGGRGFMTSSQPLEQANVFSTTDIRGELPAGYEVELYVNEVLRGSQKEAVRGNYEFLSVPLSFGLNVIRLVFYGPRGERLEEVRRVNVGTTQIPKGEFRYAFSVLQQNKPLVELRKETAFLPGAGGIGDLRVVGSLAYGLTDDLTLVGGVAHYTPNTLMKQRSRQLATAGFLTSLAGFATEFQVATDSRGGRAFALGLGGRPLGVSFLARHSEYSGGFIDELQIRDLSAAAKLRRSSDLALDWSPKLPLVDVTLPISAHVQRSEFVDGSWRLLADNRLSMPLGRYLFSAGWQYQRDKSASGATNTMSNGTLDLSALVWGTWQVRAEAALDANRKFRVSSASVLVDGSLSDSATLRLGATQNFGSRPATTMLVSGTWLLPRFDLSLNTTYTPQTGDARVELQLSLGAVFDPLESQYVPVRPGAAAGGNAAIDAFVDGNGNGIRDPGETGLSGLAVQAGNWPATSGASGEILTTGLGDGAHARIRIDPDSINNPYLQAPADVIEVVPHPGKMEVVPLPLRALGEVTIRAMFEADGKPPRGLSALRLQLVSSDGHVVAEGRTEFDGTLIIERLPCGDFSLRVDPGQAASLRLRLRDSVTVSVPMKGGYVGEKIARIIKEPSPAN